MVPSTSLSNATLEPNKLSEELPAEFVLVNLKGSLSVLCGYLICQITGGSGSLTFSESKEVHCFQSSTEPKSESENHQFQLFQKHQRTNTFVLKDLAKN
jgi:hypothetical protein